MYYLTSYKISNMQFSVGALFFGLVASAAAAPHIVGRDEPATCGNNEYTADQVAEAMAEACEHFESGSDVNDYPHTYNNYEGFEFKGLDGPFQEFPIVSGGPYTGG